MSAKSVIPAGWRAVWALLAVFLVSAVAAGAADAQIGRCGLEFWYYSDATYTDVVGIYGWMPWSCNCQNYGAGEVTPYRIVLDSFC